MILILILKFVVLSKASVNDCDEKYCSRLVDYVCAMSKSWDGTILISKLTNACHLEKVACHMRKIAEVTQVPMSYCNSTQWKNTRRVHDFSIVGAHQVCNHSCPTYCVDTYEPSCAQIWNRFMNGSEFRVLVNHCHIDLLSCALGVNVTIVPLGSCYKNGSGILFMSQIAAMKSMGLLDNDDNIKRKRQTSRRSGVDSFGEDNSKLEAENILRQLLSKSLSDILRKYKKQVNYTDGFS